MQGFSASAGVADLSVRMRSTDFPRWYLVSAWLSVGYSVVKSRHSVTCVLPSGVGAGIGMPAPAKMELISCIGEMVPLVEMDSQRL